MSPKLQVERITNINQGDTGNGPCIEITFEDGSMLVLSDQDGCGYPIKGDGAWSMYNPQFEMTNHDHVIE